MKNIPVYRHSWHYACEHRELPAFRKSAKANVACKEAVIVALAENYSNNTLKSDAALQQLTDTFGIERVAYIIALTIREKSWDGRFSSENVRWAKSIPVWEEQPDYDYHAISEYVIGSTHPGLLDLLARKVRFVYSNLDYPAQGGSV